MIFGVPKLFPHSSVGKESTCNAGDPGSIPRWGRSTGEGIGYPLQHSWASLVAQLVKNLPAMRETWVQSLGWEDPLEKGKATQSSILAWRISWTIQSMGLQRVGHDWVTFTSQAFPGAASWRAWVAMLVYYPLNFFSFFFHLLHALWCWSQCPYRFQNESLYNCFSSCKAVMNWNEFFASVSAMLDIRPQTAKAVLAS